MIKLKNEMSGGTNHRIGPGVWIHEVEILGVKDLSNYPTHPERELVRVGEKETPTECCIEVTFKDGEYDKKKQIWQWWAKDKHTKAPIGWSQFKNAVIMFFVSCVGENEFEVNDDWTIPESMINKCSGKTVLAVHYQTNRWSESKTSDWAGYSKDYWKFMFPKDMDKLEIQRLWEENLQYTQDYGRDIAIALEEKKKEDKTSKEISENKSFVSAEDDDLPF